MKTYKVIPNSYVYPSVVIRGLSMGVDSQPIKTLNADWIFTEGQSKIVEHHNIIGMDKYGTGSIGTYYWVRLPKVINTLLRTDMYHSKEDKKENMYRVFGFYVHSSRVIEVPS